MQNILISVSHHDLAKAEKLDYDLFNARGEIIYKKDQKIDSGFLLMTQFIKAFRKDTTVLEDLDNQDINSEIIEFIKELLMIASKNKDRIIDIEPRDNEAKILLKIGEIVEDENLIDKDTYNSILFLLKKYANLNSNSGSKSSTISISLFNKVVSFMLKLKPTSFGEHISVKLIDKENAYIPEIKELCLSRQNFDVFNSLVSPKKGMILISGEEDSGKATTAYSLLKSLQESGSQISRSGISTLENVVKYQLPGISQNQEDSQSPIYFSNKLSEILKEKSKIVLVIDVNETMVKNIAYKAALKDHLILATVKADNSVQVLHDILESGIDPYLVAEATTMILSQKLLRKICDNCKEKYQVAYDEVEKLFIWDKKSEVYFYKGKGCPQCHNTGYLGKIPVQEVLIFDNNIRKIIIDKKPFQEIKQYIKINNFKDLKHDAIKKVLRGFTTIEEFISIS